MCGSGKILILLLQSKAYITPNFFCFDLIFTKQPAKCQIQLLVAFELSCLLKVFSFHGAILA